MSHTPGPWRWLNNDTLVGDHGKRPVVLVGDDLTARDPTHGSLVGFDKDSSDGRLIAAAPDLLAALKALDPANGHRTDCNERKCTECSTCRARLAIAKAEGR